jgi:hypothetical protein
LRRPRLGETRFAGCIKLHKWEPKTFVSIRCLELPIESFNRFRREHPHVGERIARNLAAILAKRLILANAKIDLLSA